MMGSLLLEMLLRVVGIKPCKMCPIAMRLYATARRHDPTDNHQTVSGIYTYIYIYIVHVLLSLYI